MYTPYGITPKERAAVAETGYWVHCIAPSDYDYKRMNMHTHYLPENLNHPDVQIVLLESVEFCYNLLWEIVERIKQGEKFTDGQIYYSLFKNDDIPVEFVKARETGRDVLKVLIGDRKGRLPRDPECDPIYRIQGEAFDFDVNFEADSENEGL